MTDQIYIPTQFISASNPSPESRSLFVSAHNNPRPVPCQVRSRNGSLQCRNKHHFETTFRTLLHDIIHALPDIPRAADQSDESSIGQSDRSLFPLNLTIARKNEPQHMTGNRVCARRCRQPPRPDHARTAVEPGVNLSISHIPLSFVLYSRHGRFCLVASCPIHAIHCLSPSRCTYSTRCSGDLVMSIPVAVGVLCRTKERFYLR